MDTNRFRVRPGEKVNLRRYSPVVALDAPDGLWIEATGVTHLFGGNPEMLAKLEYDQQKRQLDSLPGHKDEVFVATYMVAQLPDGSVRSMSSWTPMAR